MKASDTAPLTRAPGSPRVTALGFGGAPLGNLYARVDEADAQAALDAAWDAGIRYVDTAPQYGLGRSEYRVADALGRWGREAVTLSTKIGRLLLDCAPDEVTPEKFVDVPRKRIVFDYGRDGVMRSWEASRNRLRTERAEILYVHDVCAFSQKSQAASDAAVRQLFDQGGYDAMVELKRAGDVAAIGVGVNEWQVCERMLREAPFDVFLLAGRYTLLEQDPLDTFLPLCLERDAAIVLGAPYNSGILATGAVEGARYDYEIAPPDILDRVRRIEAICADHGVPLIAAALQFPMHHPAVRSVIPGAVSAAQVRANVEVFETPVPDALWSDLKAAGLIRADAPTP
ncbi:MAG: aldo/keto reductase [Shimia sp.]